MSSKFERDMERTKAALVIISLILVGVLINLLKWISRRYYHQLEARHGLKSRSFALRKRRHLILMEQKVLPFCIAALLYWFIFIIFNGFSGTFAAVVRQLVLFTFIASTTGVLGLRFIKNGIILDLLDDDELQRKQSGIYAEATVSTAIDNHVVPVFGGEALHGGVFVFQDRNGQEDSCEVDHIVVTPKNIYLIETKYKSGTVQVTLDTEFWNVEGTRGKSVMRNAYRQAANSSRLLQRVFGMPLVTPLVVIVGDDLALTYANNAHSVLRPEDLANYIQGIEERTPSATWDWQQVLEKFHASRSTDPRVLDLHIQRVQARYGTA